MRPGFSGPGAFAFSRCGVSPYLQCDPERLRQFHHIRPDGLQVGNGLLVERDVERVGCDAGHVSQAGLHRAQQDAQRGDRAR